MPTAAENKTAVEAYAVVDPMRAAELIDELIEMQRLLGGRRILGHDLHGRLDAHELILRGLPVPALNAFVHSFHNIEIKELSKAIGMSLRTYQRYKDAPDKPLSQERSGRIWKFAEVLAKAIRVLGSQEEAEAWLSRPAIGLEQRRPIDLLATPAGVELVEDYLSRLEYGVYT
jgi:putative toxin-antitoxin system antitoxin component (TIGR02293 family)